MTIKTSSGQQANPASPNRSLPEKDQATSLSEKTNNAVKKLQFPNPQTNQTDITDKKTEIHLADRLTEISFKSLDINKNTIDGKKFNVWASRRKTIKPKEVTQNWEWLSNLSPAEKRSLLLKFPGYLLLSPFYLAKWMFQGFEWGENHLGAAVKNFKNRRYYTEKEYVGLTEQESEETHKIINDLWTNFKGNRNTKDVVHLELRVPLKEGKPDLSGKFSFYATLRKRGKDGEYKRDEQGKIITEITLITEGTFVEDDEDDLLTYLGKVIDFSTFYQRKPYTQKQLEKFLQEGFIPYLDPDHKDKEIITDKINPTILAKKETSNNCWLHAAITGLLKNRRFITALQRYNPNEEKTLLETKINEDLKIYKKAKKDEKKFKANKQKAFEEDKRKTNSLRKCILEAKGKSTEELHSIIIKYSAAIREELGSDSLNSQEDAILSVYSNITAFLDDLNLLSQHPISIQHTQTLKELKKSFFKKEYHETGKDINREVGKVHSIDLDLSDYKDNQEIQTSDLITRFFDSDCNRLLTNFRIDKTKPKKNYNIKHEKREFDLDPNGALSFYIKRFRANRTKVNSALKDVPLVLYYQDQKLQTEPSGEAYKFKYAIIHQGNLGNGHYYTLYKEEENWFIYNADNTGSIRQITKDDSKTVEQLVQKELEDAIYLHYET